MLMPSKSPAGLCVGWRGSSYAQREVPLSACDVVCGDDKQATARWQERSKSLQSRRQARSTGCSSDLAGLRRRLRKQLFGRCEAEALHLINRHHRHCALVVVFMTI
jgi:hypothetical protein